MALFRKSSPVAFTASIEFPDVTTIATPSDPNLLGRAHYMGYTSAQVKRLQAMAPLVESVLDDVLENVLDHLMQQPDMAQLASVSSDTRTVEERVRGVFPQPPHRKHR